MGMEFEQHEKCINTGEQRFVGEQMWARTLALQQCSLLICICLLGRGPAVSGRTIPASSVQDACFQRRTGSDEGQMALTLMALDDASWHH